MRARKSRPYHSSNRRRKKAATRKREHHEAMERERQRRDARVTAEHGEHGHRVCGKKLRYGSKAEALASANCSVRHGAPTLRSYKCPYCGGWHLTSFV